MRAKAAMKPRLQRPRRGNRSRTALSAANGEGERRKEEREVKRRAGRRGRKSQRNGEMTEKVLTGGECSFDIDRNEGFISRPNSLDRYKYLIQHLSKNCSKW